MKKYKFLAILILLILLIIGINIAWSITYIDDNHVTADKITTTTTGILTGTNGTIGVTAIPLSVANGGTGSTTSGTYLDATSSVQDQINSKSASTHTQETSKGGTAQDFSASTGVPIVTSGTWSVVTKANSLGLSDIGTAPLFNTFLGDGSIFTQITTGEKNVAVGYGALAVNTSGFYNTAIGYNALVANTVGWQNTAIGLSALESNVGNGYNNTAIGVEALSANTSGNHNVGIGQSALIANTTGNNNTAVGLASIYNAQTSTQNVAVGQGALKSATDGQENVAYPVATPNFQYNTAIGTNSLLYLKNSAANNTALGWKAGYLNGFANGSGSNNVFLGSEAGYSNTGSGNVFIGYQSAYSEIGSNKLYIDNSNTTSPLIYGDFDTNAVTINGSLITSGTLGGLLTTTTTSDTTYTATTAVCSGGIVHMTAGGTVNLPIASVGMSVMTKSTTTDIMHVDPNGTDIVVLDGTALAAGNGVKSPGNAAGEYITLYCTVVNKWETMGNPKLFVDNGG